MARAEPDGYTLGVTNLTTMSLVPVIAPKTPYHPIKDFTHIACIAGAPVMLAVHPSTKVKTVAEFIEYGKTVGKPLTFASAGVGSDGRAGPRNSDTRISEVSAPIGGESRPDRSLDDETTPQEPLSRLQGESGLGRREGRSDAGAAC